MGPPCATAYSSLVYKTKPLAYRNLASEKAELAEMVQQLEGKLAVASAESKEASKAMKQLLQDFEASHTDRSASVHLS